jgi:hypothetical protein
VLEKAEAISTGCGGNIALSAVGKHLPDAGRDEVVVCQGHALDVSRWG